MQCPVAHDKSDVLPEGHPHVIPAAPARSAMQCPVAHDKDDVLPEGHPHVIPTPSESSTPAAKRAGLEKLLWESGEADGIRPKTVDEWPIPVGLDWSKPVSELLRKGTQRAHTQAEHSDGAVALTNGQLELQEYVRWLAVIWRVYDVLESALARYASHPVLSPTYNPTLLARAPEVAKDITYLLKRLPKHVSQPSKKPLARAPHITPPPFPLPPFLEEVFVDTPPALQVYMDRLNDCAADEKMARRLLAHAYVRYLGDLSGGQVIGARLRKAYGLSGLDGRRFYYFDMGGDLAAAEAGEETVGERKKKLNDVKVWYRTGMDEGAGNDEQLKVMLVQEANVAFLLNTHLFTLITPPPAEQPRYYEKIATEQARRERLAPPPPTLAEKAVTTAYLLALVFVAIFAFQLASPYLAPIGRPIWDKVISPPLENSVIPWYNTRFVPWWDSMQPTVRRIMANNARRLV